MGKRLLFVFLCALMFPFFLVAFSLTAISLVFYLMVWVVKGDKADVDDWMDNVVLRFIGELPYKLSGIGK